MARKGALMQPRHSCLRFSAILRLPALALAFHSLLSLAITTPGPNSHPVYQQLRNVALGTEALQVENLTLKRDAGTFILRSGTVCFLTPVQGKVTGAVFTGNGSFTLDPPFGFEKRSLQLLTKGKEFQENFNELVLRFTDNSYEELKQSAHAGGGSCSPGPLHNTENALRHHLKYNLSGRVLADVLANQPGGLFYAFIHGQNYNSKMLYAIDPHGLPQVAPEEVALLTWDENKEGIWTAFHLSSEYAAGTAVGTQANEFFRLTAHKIDATFERSGNLVGKDTVTFTALAEAVQVVQFDLHSTLRVQSVTTESGDGLQFIQEDKNEDAQYFVVLPKALHAGEQATITTSYSGKGAVSNEGGGNYYPIARDNWYPNTYFGDYAMYDMTLRIPKGMVMAATGSLIDEKNEGDQNVSHWRSEVPQAVAGFNFGRFKRQEAKLEKPEYLVQAYANTEMPDVFKGLTHLMDEVELAGASAGNMSMQSSELTLLHSGSMDTTAMSKKALAEGEVAIGLFSNYFGPPPYKRLAMTQQTASNYGQSWPGLVYLPITYFFDTTIRHTLRMDDPHGYFKVVAPHEVAHQWWGHMVGFRSYRDQWMSEGFAEASASIYLQVIEHDTHKFNQFWDDERQLLVEKNKEGFRAIDVGPLTMGYRLVSTRAGYDVYRRLVYPKGAYVLHMIRMMMFDRQTGDQRFKDLMHDFASTYANRAASTEDFKAMVEKHMTREMDIRGDHRMDWFFDEYVYGTALPAYKLDYSYDKTADGVLLKLKIAQSNVDKDFSMLVPLYLETADGKIMSMGRVTLHGTTAFDFQVPLKGLKDPPKKVMINYLHDVLEYSN